MATEQQIKNFIAEIAPCAQYAYRTIGKVLPSVCIGMACVESGYGSSSIMRNHNAYFGQKVGSGKTATRYWGGKFFTSRTKEEYSVGTHTVITSAFRAYDSMQQSVLNYYELLNTKLYSRVTSGVGYVTQMQQIKLCEYMTSSKEVNSVIKLIQKCNLTQYDSGVAQTANLYQVGNIYTLQSDMYVRQSPNGEKIKFDSLTEDGKRHGKFDNQGNAILLKGTHVTCKGISGQWMQIPSGYVCTISDSGKVYIL